MGPTEEEYYAVFDKRRNDWDYDEIRAASTRTWESGIYIAETHHTGARGPRDLTFEGKRRWLLTIERYHELTKRWSDIFYNIFVFADGEVWEGRQPLRASQGDLARAFTVHIPGNDTGMTEPQFASYMKVLHMITGGNPAFVRDHQARVGPSGTYCCGDLNRSFMEQAKAQLPTYKEAGMPAPSVVQPSIDLAIEVGIAGSYGDEDGDGTADLIDEDSPAETWRAVVFATRAYEKSLAATAQMIEEAVANIQLPEVPDVPTIEEIVTSAVPAVIQALDLPDTGVDVDAIVAQVTADVRGALDNTEITLSQTAHLSLE